MKALRIGIGVAAMAVLMVTGWSPAILAKAPTFSFQLFGTLGDAAPGTVGFSINDFEPGAINNRGDVVFGTDLGTANDPSTFFGEGVFLLSKGQRFLLEYSTGAAPGGGTFDAFFLGPITLNDPGNVAFGFALSPVMLPFGVNAGVYRSSHGTVSPVVVPFVTPSPTGGAFQGASFGPSLNNGGDLVFPGIIQTASGIHVPGETYIGLGMGIFGADKKGMLSSVVVPGDAAPGGGTFDFADSPWLNGGGDVAFVGHVAGEAVFAPGSPAFAPQATLINAPGNVYLRNAATGQIESIAHAGDPAPGGGTFLQALSPVMNDPSSIAFIGDLGADALQTLGVFLYRHGQITAIAQPGDAMPGGGHLVTASPLSGEININNAGDIVFDGTLDTSTDGVPDTGLFLWSKGNLLVVARTGTVIPGVGTVTFLGSPAQVIIGPAAGFFANGGARSNDQGQIVFAATLTDGRGVLLLATPR